VCRHAPNSCAFGDSIGFRVGDSHAAFAAADSRADLDVRAVLRDRRRRCVRFG
jgi:hypothetical protein